MKTIQLTQGQVAQVDDADYEWLNAHKWHAEWDKIRKFYYARRNEYLGKINGQFKSLIVLMHRLILGLEHGDQRIVDHKKPSETLNNQRDNLRIAKDNSESVANQQLRVTNSTGFKGVSRKGSGYQADITVNGKKKYLGYRKTPEAAHALWWTAAHQAHGEFARVA